MSSDPFNQYLHLTPLEVATGVVVGREDAAAPVSNARHTPLEALGQAVLPALLRPPCVVAFSGGRDSSAVLAVALEVAKREGLPEPVALTRRWPAYPGTDETYWQELVVKALGVRHWERVDLEESDVIGPLAGDSLRRRGVLWPPFAHALTVLFARASGGSLVTGEGGDEVLGARRCSPFRNLLGPKTRRARRQVKRALVSLGPRPVREWGVRHRYPDLASWLVPDLRRDFLRSFVEDQASEPWSWAASLRWHLRSRSVVLGTRNLEVLAGESGAVLSQPLLDPGFISALARAGGPLGFHDRTAAMRSVFHDLLPDELLRRNTKAFTTSVVFGEWSRRFMGTWDGKGVDSSMVDIESLRLAWSEPSPPPNTALLLQQAWLESEEARESRSHERPLPRRQEHTE